MQSVGRVIVQRVARALLTLWLVVTVVFFIFRLSGDPVALLLSDTATPAQVEALRGQLGLDRPMPVQYAKYVASMAQGDFGASLCQRRPAFPLVLERFPATVQLAAVSFALAAVVGLSV